jgi:hypothetical protein
MEKPNKLAGYSCAGELLFCRILAVSRMAEIAALSMPLFHITAICLLALAEFVSGKIPGQAMNSKSFFLT